MVILEILAIFGCFFAILAIWDDVSDFGFHSNDFGNFSNFLVFDNFSNFGVFGFSFSWLIFGTFL